MIFLQLKFGDFSIKSLIYNFKTKCFIMAHISYIAENKSVYNDGLRFSGNVKKRSRKAPPAQSALRITPRGVAAAGIRAG